MQLSLRPYITAGVAIAGASVIAATPITPTPTQLASEVHALQSSSAAVELTALAEALDTSSWVDPIANWGEVFELAGANLLILAEAASADPFPVLSQVIENQTGYADIIGMSVSTSANRVYTYLTDDADTPGSFQQMIKQAQLSLESGNVERASTWINASISGLFGRLQPMLGIMAIPYQIGQNVTNVLRAMTSQSLFDPGIIGYVGFGALNTVTLAVTAAGRAAQTLNDAAETGDPVTLLSAIVNTPAKLTDEFLNGPIYKIGNRLIRGSGFLTLANENEIAWNAVSAVINLPRAIAAAITPPADAAAEVESAVAVDDVASLPAADAATTPESNTAASTVKEFSRGATDAVNGITQTATSAFDAMKSVTLKLAPQVEEKAISTAAAPSTSGAAANLSVDSADESPNASESDAVRPADATEGATNVSVVNADKESKKQTRKDARAAKRQARQEAKADKQPAKPATNTGGKHRLGKVGETPTDKTSSSKDRPGSKDTDSDS
ncbi:hypothetical protein ABQF34_27950 [Mycolicibacterium boenickei]